MTQDEKATFAARLSALERRIEQVRAHLDGQRGVSAAVKEKLKSFAQHAERLKDAMQPDHDGIKGLEQGFETWIGAIDKEYGAPPGREKNVSM